MVPLLGLSLVNIGDAYKIFAIVGQWVPRNGYDSSTQDLGVVKGNGEKSCLKTGVK